MNFELGGIVVPILACLEFSQTYELIGGSVFHRMQSGRAVKQTHFNKLKTVLSGQGWVPAGLDGLNYAEPMLLKCGTPRAISSVSNKVVIPAARRRDPGFEPTSYAIVNGEMIKTGCRLEANIAILDPIADAACYQVQYYPEIMVFAEPLQTQVNINSVEFVWSLVCEGL